jgi:hypothetical protein
MDEPVPLKVAQDVVRQIVSLSTGLIGLTLTFRDQLAAGRAWDWLLQAAWLLLGASVVAGVLFQLMYTGVLSDGDSTARLVDWRLRGPWLAQVLLFLLGLVCFVVFGFQRF